MASPSVRPSCHTHTHTHTNVLSDLHHSHVSGLASKQKGGGGGGVREGGGKFRESPHKTRISGLTLLHSIVGRQHQFSKLKIDHVTQGEETWKYFNI